MSVEKIDGWRCKDCEYLFPDEDDAKSCCGSEYDEKTIYICDECGEEYDDDEDEAAGCCAAEEYEYWACSECDDKYETKEEAQQCCGDPNDL